MGCLTRRRILEGKLTLELLRDGVNGGNELGAGLLDCCLRCYGPVCLDLDEEVGVERVRDFVACKGDLGHSEELAVEAVSRGRDKRGTTYARSMLPRV